MEISSAIFTKPLTSLWVFLGSNHFLFAASLASFFLKGIFLVFLLRRKPQRLKTSTSWMLLVVLIAAAMTEDFAWIIKLTKTLIIPALDYRIVFLFIRVAWGLSFIKYQSLALFIESLCKKNMRIKLRHLPFLLVTSFLFVFFIGSAALNFSSRTVPLATTVMSVGVKYCLFVLMPVSLFLVIWNLRILQIPKIIKRQIGILIKYLIVPIVAADFAQTFPFNFSATFVSYAYSTVGLSTIVMTCAIYYSARKIMGLRFLNFHNHVMAKKRFEFIDDFKNVIEQFALVTSERELAYITKNFFKDAFSVPTHKVRLHIRKIDQDCHPQNMHHADQERKDLELFASVYGNYLEQEKIVIADEVSFDSFYTDDDKSVAALQFMEKTEAEVILPIYAKNSCVAYIIVEVGARTGTKKEFYSNVERDQMLIFATYLGNIIHLLNNKNVDALVAQEKELREELYSKHQKINQYQESIRSFLRSGRERKVGIMFYKNRRFTFGNQTAQDLVQMNVNTHAGHPLTKALKKVTQQAIEYKTQQTCFAHDSNGKRFVFTAIPSVEHNGVTISMHYPEVSDVLKHKMDLLSDPSKWDYLLYLETTKSGKLINKLIPGSSETLLNFKIDLLKAALSKKAVLLDVPHDDVMATAELLHEISLREELHVLNLQGLTKSVDIGIQLFGANPLFGLHESHGQPLFEKLNDMGTLFIRNIHFLDFQTQELLADFIRCGFYCLYKTDQRKNSDVRIICSTERDLKAMVQEGSFSNALFDELTKTTLVMPSLMTFPEQDIHDLADSVIKQAIKDNTLENLLELTGRERRNLIQAKPASIQELKKRVYQILEKKSQEHASHKEECIVPVEDSESFELNQALRLGKNALRDRKIMAKLWERFKNQNKIATFLGVNRSSVNRRCKEYGLLP